MKAAFPKARLRHVATIRPSNVDKKSLAGEREVRLCNYTDVYYSDEIREESTFMRATAPPDQIARFTLRAGDVLLTKDSESPDDIGVVAHVPEDLDGVVCGYHLSLIRPDGSRINPKFLFWALKAQAARATMSAAALGITRFALRSGEVASLEVPLPSLQEQVRIADFLDGETARINALMAHKKGLLDRLEERRRSVLFRGVIGMLAAREDAYDGGLPWAQEIRDSFRTVKIKHAARLGTGHTPSRLHPEYWEDCTIPWITTGEIQQVRNDRAEVIAETRERISELGLANSSAELHPAGTVVLCRTASAGYSAIMGEDMATSQDFVTWTCSERLLPRYLLMCLRAMRPDLLGRLAFGSTHKTIYMPDIEDLRIPLPSVDEQRDILADIDRCLANIDALVSRLSHQLQLLAEHHQALITAAVTGQINVDSRVA